MPPASETLHEVTARLAEDVLHERHWYPPGPAGVLPSHVHDTFQLCLSVNFAGEYQLRGNVYEVPAGRVSVIAPGEVHGARDPVDRRVTSAFLVAYVPVDQFLTVARDLELAIGAEPPAFPAPVLADAKLARAMAAWSAAAMGDASHLEADERRLAVIAGLLVRHGDRRVSLPRVGRERRAVAAARDYLHAHPTGQVRLADLARPAGLSPFRLARAFRAEVGLPPHAYHLALRISLAKRLLAEGASPARAAAEAGFFDQSHLGRYFLRFVGATPGRYVEAARTS